MLNSSNNAVLVNANAVSYTHLDVYKRQLLYINMPLKRVYHLVYCSYLNRVAAAVP